jgi:hypothetical protein
MGMLYSRNGSAMEPDWEGMQLRPVMMCRLLAERLDIIFEVNDEMRNPVEQLRKRCQDLEMDNPNLWNTVYQRCSRVERIQLFKTERRDVLQEWHHLWSTCQEPRRMMLLTRELHEASVGIDFI